MFNQLTNELLELSANEKGYRLALFAVNEDSSCCCSCSCCCCHV